MQIIEQKRLGFDDITLISHEVSEIESRDDIQPLLNFCNTKLSIPILASPMKSVCNSTVAKIMAENGGFGIIHRFCSLEEQLEEYKSASNHYNEVGCAIGINGDYYDRFTFLYDAGCRIFCLDVANGASARVKDAIESLLRYETDVYFIVGNVVSARQFKYLAYLPSVYAIRTSVGTGSGCSTTDATGVYDKPISLILECHEIKRICNLNTIIIADGGINQPSQFCKAIACGADAIMLGSQIAKTTDSPAELLKVPLPDGEFKFYKVYSGSASEDTQKIYKTNPKYIEGRTKLLEFHNEPLVKVLNRYMDGLRSSMSYFNSRSVEEYRNNVIIGLM